MLVGVHVPWASTGPGCATRKAATAIEMNKNDRASRTNRSALLQVCMVSLLAAGHAAIGAGGMGEVYRATDTKLGRDVNEKPGSCSTFGAGVVSLAMNEEGGARWLKGLCAVALLCLPAAAFPQAGRAAPLASTTLSRGEARVWDTQEIVLRAGQDYPNPYVDVVCWIDLEGPGSSRRVYGFWDGGRTFKVRFVATAPGEWRWRSGSNQQADPGLNGGTRKAARRGLGRE